MSATGAIATLALSPDAERRTWYAREWRSRFPIAYESLLPLGRVTNDQQTAVGEITARLASLVDEPTGVVCSIVGSSPEAQSGLLLSLESLDPMWRVLVLASDLTRVLPTIRSRTISYDLGRWSDDELHRLALERELPLELVPAARGSLARLELLAKIESVGSDESFSGWIARAKGLTRDELADAVQYSHLERRGEILEQLARGTRAEWALATEWTP